MDNTVFVRGVLVNVVKRLIPFGRTPMDAAMAALALLAYKVRSDNSHLFPPFELEGGWTALTSLDRTSSSLEHFHQLLTDLAERDERYRYWPDAVNLFKEADGTFRECLFEMDNVYSRVDTLAALSFLTGPLVHVALDQARTVDTLLLGAFGALAEVTAGLVDPPPGSAVYDPSCGMADQLIALQKRQPHLSLYGQDNSLLALTVAQLNAFLNGVERIEFALADTLANPAFKDDWGPRQFDVVLSVPPFGQTIGNVASPSMLPGRFPLREPKGRNLEWAFIQDALYRTRSGGQTLVMVRSGVLNSSGHEAKLRKDLLETDMLDLVVSLPSRLLSPYLGVKFQLLRFQKSVSKTRRSSVLFIDASKDFADEHFRKEPPSVALWVRQLVTHPEEFPTLARWVSHEEIEQARMSWLPEIYLRPEEQAPNLEALEHEVAQQTQVALEARERFLKVMKETL